MNFVRVNRKVVGAYHDPDCALIGQIIKNHIRSISFKKPSAIEVIAASFHLPAGKPFYDALRMCPLKTLLSNENELLINNAKSSADNGGVSSILIPNFLKLLRVSPKSVSQFRRLHDHDLSSEIVRLTARHLKKGTSWAKICAFLESTLIGSGFSPSEICYLNFEKPYASIK